MTFRTRSGSLYELNVEHRRVRRLEGAKAPTARQGADGEWRHYERAWPQALGVYFDWNGDGKGTLTSVVEDADRARVFAALVDPL